jgi:Fe-S-cluster containining protein
MTAARVTRPVVRNFDWPYQAEAASWVRAGGHAVVWLSTRKARLFFAKPADGDEFDLGRWSALDLGRSDYSIETAGAFAGLAYLRLPHDCFAIVRDRATRDSVHPGPTREIALDCLACAACCKDNRVELEDDDVARFERAGRGELARRPYARRKDGTVILVLRKDKRCKHLEDDNRCGIYAIRPGACSTFPPGSECCLSAREEETGMVDGLRPEYAARLR